MHHFSTPLIIYIIVSVAFIVYFIKDSLKILDLFPKDTQNPWEFRTKDHDDFVKGERYNALVKAYDQKTVAEKAIIKSIKEFIENWTKAWVVYAVIGIGVFIYDSYTPIREIERRVANLELHIKSLTRSGDE